MKQISEILFLSSEVVTEESFLKEEEEYSRQSPSLHLTVFLAGPSSLQSFPPLNGGGLVQVLVSVFFPSPHDTLHSDSDHSVYPPSMTCRRENNSKILTWLGSYRGKIDVKSFNWIHKQ